MAPKRLEPEWVSRELVQAIHDELLDQHGGLAGVRDDGLIHSALERPRNRWAYDEEADLFECAAAYGFGLAKNHGFNDGNKRTAFQAMYTFLGINGLRLVAEEPEAVAVMLALAEGKLSERKLAGWLRKSCEKW